MRPALSAPPPHPSPIHRGRGQKTASPDLRLGVIRLYVGAPRVCGVPTEGAHPYKGMGTRQMGLFQQPAKKRNMGEDKLAENGRSEGQSVYDPRGVVEAKPQAVAPRARALDGARLGVLDNTKWNANKLLRRSVGLLRSEINFATVNSYRKESFSRSAAPQLIEEIAAQNDVVLTAIGD